MHQDWGKLLFMHWRIPPEDLRPHIPQRLAIDTFDGSAWIAVTPFTMWDIRAFPPFLPPVPGLNSMHELNVRTYVHLDGVPGVWFFSLDANSTLAVMGARTLYHLPYYNAEIKLDQQGETVNYSLRRAVETNGLTASFEASYTIGERLPEAVPGTLEFFLVERYCLYASHQEEIYRARIFHQPWPLQTANLSSLSSNMIEADGLRAPGGEPLLHYAEEVNVDIWKLEARD
jgi:uncharacterized protein YqjF (DUF2071 family)